MKLIITEGQYNSLVNEGTMEVPSNILSLLNSPDIDSKKLGMIMINSIDPKEMGISSLARVAVWWQAALNDSTGYITDMDIEQVKTTDTLHHNLDMIEVVPDEIAKVPNIKQFKFRGDDTVLHPNIGKFIHATHLDLSRTGLTKLPESIGQLKNLQVLNLQLSKMQELPQSITTLSNLREINLAATPMVKLPDGLENMTSLKTLILTRSSFSLNYERRKEIKASLPNVNVRF